MSVCSRGMVNKRGRKSGCNGKRQAAYSFPRGRYCPGAPVVSYRLPIVRIAPRGGRHVGVDLDKRSAQYPAALAGRETRREHSIVDLAGYGEATEHRRGKIQPFVVGKAVGRGVDIADIGSDDAVALRINTLDFICVGFEQSTLQLLLVRHEGSWTFINVEENLVSQSAGHAALPKLALVLETDL